MRSLSGFSRSVSAAALVSLAAAFAHAAPSAAAPSRVASLLPSHTDIVRALGAGDALVAVSDWESEASAGNLPRVGGLIPNWEGLAAVRPDIVLADVSHARRADLFERIGVRVEFLPATKASSFEDVYALIARIGALLDKSREAEALVSDMKIRTARVLERRAAGAPRVFFEGWPQPIKGYAPDTLQGRLLEMAGAVNVVPPSKRDVPTMSAEWVVAQSPDVILHTGIVTSESVAARPGWDRVPAVRSGRVYEVNADDVSRAAPRIVDALERLVELLHATDPAAAR